MRNQRKRNCQNVMRLVRILSVCGIGMGVIVWRASGLWHGENPVWERESGLSVPGHEAGTDGTEVPIRGHGSQETDGTEVPIREQASQEADGTEVLIKEHESREADGSSSAKREGAKQETEGSNLAAEDAQESNERAQPPDLSVIRAMEAGVSLDVSGLSGEMQDSLFYSMELPEDVRQRIVGVSYPEGGSVSISMEELRYLRVLHMGFDGQVHIGELIVNESIAEDVLAIMAELYRQSYPIEKMVLVDAYGADDVLSMEDNNTCAFNYREIAGSSRLSKHALGLAIDVNPKYNPYVKQESGGERLVSPAVSMEYADRDLAFPYKIDEEDLCCRLFLEYGFSWGGNWSSVKDYQHFEKE